jgi:hypothetical protein
MRFGTSDHIFNIHDVVVKHHPKRISGVHIIFWNVCIHPTTREKCPKFLIKSSIFQSNIVKHFKWYGQFNLNAFLHE